VRPPRRKSGFDPKQAIRKKLALHARDVGVLGWRTIDRQLCQYAGLTSMAKTTGKGQSGGVNIGGTVGPVGGDIVGRDKHIGIPLAAELDVALRPLLEAIEAAPTETRAEAEAKVTALKREVVKGKDANDGVIGKLVDGLVGLVPGAATAVVSAFGTPILGGIAGPVTTFVLDKLRGK
jgi:hypothetical protein